MAFRGIYPAPDLVHAPCGLLSVARVMTHTTANYDERWVRGFSYEFDSQPEVELFTVNDATVTGGTVGTSTLPQFKEYDPFFIQVTDTRSYFGINGEDRFATAKKQLEAVTQKAIELELWEGVASIAETNGNDFLRKAGAASVVNTGALAPAIVTCPAPVCRISIDVPTGNAVVEFAGIVTVNPVALLHSIKLSLSVNPPVERL